MLAGHNSNENYSHLKRNIAHDLCQMALPKSRQNDDHPSPPALYEEFDVLW
jgi:hypothetical protein